MPETQAADQPQVAADAAAMQQPQVAAPNVTPPTAKAAGKVAADEAKAPPADEPEDGRDAEISRLKLELEAAGKPQDGRFMVPTVEMRVMPPHVEMHHGGVTLGTDWTEVPEHMSAALQGAAQDAGVKIEQKEG